MALSLALASTGCQLAITTTSTSGTGDPMIAEPVGADLVRALDLADVGLGPVSWWASDAEVARPAGEVAPIGPFVPVGHHGVTDVVHPNVTPARAGSTAPEVVLRPAWSTKVDSRSSATPTTLSVADEATISFSTPGAPGQFLDDANREVLEITADLTVGGGTCEDVVGLQVWQVGPPDVEAPDGAIQADYRGSLLVRAPCA